ncbi:uncharacterized protein LOC143046863 [Mytilus galloprovincialis]|uniref:uncharacterized protein LOC143046863 n=1 Tax=Mytilus galloprovincialis TaxID=29158 RepID=UPI003F7B5415
MVDGILTCKSRDEIQKVKQRIRDNRLADFLTNYLDTIGLNIELGLTIKEKVEVIVFEIEDETNKTKSSTNTSKIVDGLKETQIEDTNVNNKTVSKEIVGEKVSQSYDP